MTSTTQLFLLSDHLKLSLFELQRAQSLSLDVESGKVSDMKRSLRALISGIENAERRLEAAGALSSHDLQERDKLTQLRLQYQDLRDQITAVSPAADTNSEDIEEEEEENGRRTTETVTTKTTASETLEENIHRSTPPPLQQPVPRRPRDFAKYRPTDSPSGSLSPYHDSPSPGSSDISAIGNEELLSNHYSIMNEQDQQLDVLGQSIGRQRSLGIQIGDELDGQVELLTEVEGQVDQNISGLGRARTRLDRIDRGGGDGLGGSTGCAFIVGLIVILIVLVALVK